MIKDLLKKHEHYRNETINLIPSENSQSSYVKSALSSDLQGRYFFRHPFVTMSGAEYRYQGGTFVSEIFDKTELLIKEIFNAKFVNLSMLSGHQCSLALLLKHCKPEDNIICTSTKNGGYPGLDPQMLPAFLGLNVLPLPQINGQGSDIDLDKLRQTLLKNSCKLLFLSHSIVLFPYKLMEIRQICDEFGVIIVYDASHPMGLIAGGLFQDPLNEGAHYLIGSTHKSLPGPQGGIVVSNDFSIEDVSDFVTVDNFGLARVAALGAAFEEMKAFGNKYATSVIKNSKALGSAIASFDLPILYADRDFSMSHQVLLDITKIEDYHLFTKKLEENQVIVDNSGRLGTSEVTLKNSTPEDMVELARFISNVYFNRNNLKRDKETLLHFFNKKRGYTFDIK